MELPPICSWRVSVRTSSAHEASSSSVRIVDIPIDPASVTLTSGHLQPIIKEEGDTEETEDEDPEEEDPMEYDGAVAEEDDDGDGYESEGDAVVPKGSDPSS